MRNWKNWLFPILTALTVAALSLLPLRLSTLEDGRLAETVHAEPLTADNNFPFKPPELPGRVWLLVQYHSMPEFLTIVQQEPEAEKQKELSAQARTELQKLAELGILPETSGVYNADFSASLLYLRDQRDLSSASFAMLDAYDQKAGKILSLYLDQESGHILALELFSKQLRTFPPRRRPSAGPSWRTWGWSTNCWRLTKTAAPASAWRTAGLSAGSSGIGTLWASSCKSIWRRWTATP